jgi:DNA-binding transcriptional LysR family regulator
MLVEAPSCTLRTLRLPQSEIAEALESGEIDLAFGSLKAMPQGMFQQQLFSHRFVTIVSTRNREVGDRITAGQFSAMRHVVVALSREKGAHYDDVVEELGLTRRIFFITQHFLVVPTIIGATTDLIATVPRWLVERYALPGTVRIVQPPYALPGFALRQHWHPRFHHDQANVWLRALISSLFVDEEHEMLHPPKKAKKRRASVSKA